MYSRRAAAALLVPVLTMTLWAPVGTDSASSAIIMSGSAPTSWTTVLRPARVIPMEPPSTTTPPASPTEPTTPPPSETPVVISPAPVVTNPTSPVVTNPTPVVTNPTSPVVTNPTSPVVTNPTIPSTTTNTIGGPLGGRYGIIAYSGYDANVARWIDQRFGLVVGGQKPSAPGSWWVTYFDIYGPGSLADMKAMKDFAVASGFNYENMLLHARTNYTHRVVGTIWSQLDKFDAFENANGVLRSVDDSSYTDLTGTAYNGSVTLSNRMYIGYEEPFDRINMQFSRFGQSVNSQFQYWDGYNWKNLTISDGTNRFTANGRIQFTPPYDWAPRKINNSRNKYFVRILFNSATTLPVTSRIYGDNWLNGANNAGRGWDYNSGSIINKGRPTEYNPTPPAASSARFPYQARITYWGSNHFIANPAYTQTVNGVTTRPWSKFAAIQITNMVRNHGYQGVMCDDGERDPDWDGVPISNTDMVRYSSRGWLAEAISRYADIVTYAKQINPSVKVGINAMNKEIVKKGDWNLYEYINYAYRTNPVLLSVTDNAGRMTYDDYLPANNPRNVQGFLVYADVLDKVPDTGSVNVPWDRANRGPLACLSKHYIGDNENTMFAYYSRGGYIYSETDQVYLKDGRVLRLSVNAAPRVEDVYRWATFFPAMAVDIGTPDPNGHNGGKRDVQWKLGSAIGGGPNIWRRDYTKAIVLHRLGEWGISTGFNTYSNSIWLGGTYYPLRADGKTGPATQSIQLRAGEGAILMKAPIY